MPPLVPPFHNQKWGEEVEYLLRPSHFKTRNGVTRSMSN